MDPEIGSLAGSLLLAHPSLRESTFHRTVILMSAHDENGAMGLVLNRPLGKSLGSVASEFALGPLAEIPVFRGGPVDQDRMLLCAWRFHPGGIGFQLMVGIEPNRAIQLQSEIGMHMRAFIGYTGWSSGQLEGEMKQNTWVNSPTLPNLMDLSTNENLWRSILISLDPMWKLFISEPADPEAN